MRGALAALMWRNLVARSVIQRSPTGPSGGGLQRASDQDSRNVNPVLLGTSHVSDGRNNLACRLCRSLERLIVERLIRQQLVDSGGQKRSRRDGSQCHASRLDDVTAGVKLQAGADADDGDVHFISRDHPPVMRAAVGQRLGQAEFDQQLARLQDVLSRTGAEVFDRDFASSLRTGDHANGSQGDQAGSRIGGGARIADITAQTGAALNLNTANDIAAVGNGGEVLLYLFRCLDAVAGNGGSDVHAGGVPRQNVQFGKFLNVDHQFRPQSTDSHLIDQVRTAGQQADLAAMPSQQRDHLRQAIRSLILKSMHVAPPFLLILSIEHRTARDGVF